MNRLQRELHRLYVPQAPAGLDTAPNESSLIDSSGGVRAMVLALARPADWDALLKVWQGVQADLDLPAPAIAVSGKDGYQLWFSLSQPVPARQAMAFLESLRTRYLGEIKPQRVGMMPSVDALSALQVVHARMVPAQLAGSEHWSAFVSPDLARMFADEPWLDIPPNPDGQAGLLAHLESMQAADFQHALEQGRPAVLAVHTPPAADPAAVAVAGAGLMNKGAVAAGLPLDPKRFLLNIMNDDTVALGLRIEAAKALLPYCDDAGQVGLTDCVQRVNR